MKKSFTSIALSTFCLASIVLSASAQDKKDNTEQEPTTKPVVTQRTLTPAELQVTAKYRAQVDQFIAANKGKSTIKFADFTNILKKAHQDKVPEQVIHQYLRDVVKSFPNYAPHALHSAIMSYGKPIHPERAISLAKTAVVSHPTPFSSIPPIMAQLRQINVCEGLGIDFDALTIDLANIAPDNPLTPVVVSNNETTSDPDSDTPRIIARPMPTGFAESFISRVPLPNPTDPEAVSPAGGQQPVKQ